MLTMHTKVRLRVGGKIFETFEESLLRFPNTILGNPIRRFKFYNTDFGYFEFNRDPHIFDYVLFFYQSNGILAKPDFISDEDFHRELDFFGLLTPHTAENAPMPRNKYQRMLWEIMEYPEMSRVGRVLSHLSVIIVILSIVTLCLESTKKYQRPMKVNNEWFILESFYVGWFSAEYFARVIGAPNKRKFLFSFFGLIDVLAILPYFGAIIISGEHLPKHGFSFIRTLRLLQVLRIFKISRHSRSMRLFGRALMYCKGQMGCMIFFFFINCLFAASVMHFVERSKGFESIVDSFWFCTITMTTVGYGDVVPVTPIGKIVASFCIVAGILSLFNLFIPVYLSYFSLIYELSTIVPNTSQEATEEEEVRSRSTSHRSLSITSTLSAPSRAHLDGSRVKATEEQHMNRIRLDYIRKMSTSDSPIGKAREGESNNYLPVPRTGRSSIETVECVPGSCDVSQPSQVHIISPPAMALKRKVPRVIHKPPSRKSSTEIQDVESNEDIDRGMNFECDFNVPLIVIEEC